MRVGISERLLFCAFNIPLLHANLASDIERVIGNMSLINDICIGTPRDLGDFALCYLQYHFDSPFTPLP